MEQGPPSSGKRRRRRRPSQNPVWDVLSRSYSSEEEESPRRAKGAKKCYNSGRSSWDFPKAAWAAWHLLLGTQCSSLKDSLVAVGHKRSRDTPPAQTDGYECVPDTPDDSLAAEPAQALLKAALRNSADKAAKPSAVGPGEQQERVGGLAGGGAADPPPAAADAVPGEQGSRCRRTCITGI